MVSKTRSKSGSPLQKLTTQAQSLRNRAKWQGLFPLFLFLGLVLPLGLYLVFSVPAMWAPDGGAHVARAFQIAEGGFRPVYINHERGIGYGGPVPENVAQLKELELNIVARNGAPGSERQSKLITPQDKRDIAYFTSQKISKAPRLISYVNTAAYSAVAYTPSVLAILVGYLLNLSLGHTLLLAGLCGFLTYVLFVGYGLYTLRRSQLKWALVVVALLPVPVFQSTLVTADSFLMSVSLLFCALVIKGLLVKSDLTKLDKVLLFACVVALPLIKSVYFPMVFLILLIPKNKWQNPRNFWLWAGSALGLSTIGFGIWSALTADVAASNGLVRGDYLWQYGASKTQEKFILTHPFGFLHAIFDSLLYQSKFYLDTYFGWLGFTYLQIPGVAQLSGLFALGLSLLVAGKSQVKKYTPVLVAGALLATTVLIFAVLYIAFTVPKNTFVEGVQGRYFLPVTVLIIAAGAWLLPNLRISEKGVDSAKIALVVLISFCLVFSILRYGLAIA